MNGIKMRLIFHLSNMKNQEAWVVRTLLKNGEISRNEALRNFVSRLSGIILNLKKDGWTIESGYRKTPSGKDYVYSLPKGVEQPLKLQGYYVDGVRVAEKIL